MLLDTSAFLFFLWGDERMKKALGPAIANPAAPLKVSAASFWEMTIKHRIGKLALPKPFSSDPVSAMEQWCSRGGIEHVDLTPKHIGEAMSLNFDHDDPFDRVIAATALVEGVQLVSSDKRFRACKGLNLLLV